MDYLFESVFASPPAACGILTADCQIHGFGLTKERGNELISVIYDHGDTCLNEATATADFPRFMAGPENLSLTTPAELLFVGYYMSRVSDALKKWEEEAQPQQVLKELRESVTAQQVRNGGSSPLFNWGQNGQFID